MKVNYDLAFENAKKQAQDGAKLLLHVCCAPCATYCLTRLLDKFDVTLYYANDNITDRNEWQKRLGEVQKLVEIVNNGQFVTPAKYPLKLTVKPFDSNEFLGVAKGFEEEKEGGKRCYECFALRLKQALCEAQKGDYHYFATTLTVSPYKNSQVINQVGIGIAENTLRQATTDKNLEMSRVDSQALYKQKWLPTDFKKHDGYSQSVMLSQRYDLYRQHYCGCCFGLANMQQNY